MKAKAALPRTKPWGRWNDLSKVLYRKRRNSIGLHGLHAPNACEVDATGPSTARPLQRSPSWRGPNVDWVVDDPSV